jgi:hypothetical protein
MLAIRLATVILGVLKAALAEHFVESQTHVLQKRGDTCVVTLGTTVGKLH